MIAERKIVLALQKLDKKELKEFLIFVRSPYFNVNKGLTLLYDTIFPLLESKKFKETHNDTWLWSVLNPKDTEVDARRLNLLFYNLGLLFDRFVAQKEFSEQTFFQKKLMMEILSQRKLPLERRILIRTTLEALQKNENYSATSAIYQYFTKKMASKKKREAEVILWLNIYFLIEKLSAYVTLLSWKKMYKLDVELNFMDYVFTVLTFEEYRNHPTINIYQSISDTFLYENDKKYYYILRNLINEHVDKFDIDFQREIYTTAISYCINKGNQTIVEFDIEAFNLFRESVESSIIQENNEISVSVFRNIVFAAIRVKEFNWAEYFIENYKSYVNPKFRDNAVYFSLARLEINRENYTKVLDYLQLINYEDVWYQLGARTMQIAAYYKLGEFDALESLLNAFKMYINREKSLTKPRKLTHLNLVKYTKKLIYIIPSEKTKIQNLRKEIEENPSIVNKSWLLERVDELSKSRY
jgi:hypothetical protein